MKNVTLSADEDLIEQARLIARSQNKTLNSAFATGSGSLPRRRERGRSSIR